MTLQDKKTQLILKLAQSRRDYTALEARYKLLGQMSCLTASFDGVASFRAEESRLSGYIAALEFALEGLS